MPPVRCWWEAIERLAIAGEQISLAPGCASTEFYSDGRYAFGGGSYRAAEWSTTRSLVKPLSASCRSKDGLPRNDWEGWAPAQPTAGSRVSCGRRTCSSTQTPPASSGASRRGSPNPILIKVNQIGSLTRNPASDRPCWQAGYNQRDQPTAAAKTEEHQRSPDLAVATRAGQIKNSLPAAASERVAKYNRLLASRRARRQALYAGREERGPREGLRARSELSLFHECVRMDSIRFPAPRCWTFPRYPKSLQHGRTIRSWPLVAGLMLEPMGWLLAAPAAGAQNPVVPAPLRLKQLSFDSYAARNRRS